MSTNLGYHTYDLCQGGKYSEGSLAMRFLAALAQAMQPLQQGGPVICWDGQPRNRRDDSAYGTPACTTLAMLQSAAQRRRSHCLGLRQAVTVVSRAH